MMMGNLIFISAGPNPRMRFKLVRCPVTVQVMGPASPHMAVTLRCQRNVMVFFKHIALCPVHGMVETSESWFEEGGTHDN